MFLSYYRDFNTEPELMPKTPSQKKNTRRKRVSVGRQEENQGRRRSVSLSTVNAFFISKWSKHTEYFKMIDLQFSFLARFSKGRRSNLRGSSVKPLNFIAEDNIATEASTSGTSSTTQPKRTTRKNKQVKTEVAEEVGQCESSDKGEEDQNKTPELVVEDDKGSAEVKPDGALPQPPSPSAVPSLEPVVVISSEERISAEFAVKPEASPGRTAAKIPIAGTSQNSRRSSVRCSLKLRHSLAGLRHSMTQESVRRASQRSMLKRKAARMGNSTCSSNIDGETWTALCM